MTGHQITGARGVGSRVGSKLCELFSTKGRYEPAA